MQPEALYFGIFQRVEGRGYFYFTQLHRCLYMYMYLIRLKVEFLKTNVALNMCIDICYI